MAYQLAAYDASGRRYWNSETIDFSMAPTPVGAWITASLTVMASYPCPCPVQGPPQSQLGAWYCAADAGTNNNDPVSSWIDRSNNGNDLSLMAGTSPASFKTAVAGFGSQPVVEFAGLTELEKLLPPGFQAGTQALTTYTVFEHDFLGGTERIWGYGQFPVVNGQQMMWCAFNGPPRWIVDAGANFYETSLQADGLPKIWSFTMPAGGAFNTSESRFNGELATPINRIGSMNIPSPVQRVSVGGYDAPVSRFTGRIAEILYYYKVHDTNERYQTLLYLSERYNIALV